LRPRSLRADAVGRDLDRLELEVVAWFGREVDAPGERESVPRHDDPAGHVADLDRCDDQARVASPGHPSSVTGQHEVTGVQQATLDPVIRVESGTDDHDVLGQIEAGMIGHPARQAHLDDRKRDSVSTDRLRQGGVILQGGIAADRGEAAVVQLPPQVVGPRLDRTEPSLLLELLEDRACDREQVRVEVDHAVRLRLRSRSFAITVRRTSFVPPRSVKVGAVTIASASSSSNSPAWGSTSVLTNRRMTSTAWFSNWVPMSLTRAASTAGRSPASRRRAIESDMERKVM